mgnify:CR=1 FL=1
MSISIRAYAIVGLGGEDLLKLLDQECPEASSLDTIHNWVDDEALNYVSPYYDADISEWIIGIALDLDEKTPSEIQDEINTALSDFKNITGFDGKFYVSPHVS